MPFILGSSPLSQSNFKTESPIAVNARSFPFSSQSLRNCIFQTQKLVATLAGALYSDKVPPNGGGVNSLETNLGRRLTPRCATRDFTQRTARPLYVAKASVLESRPMNIASIVAELKSERDRLDKAISALTGLNGTGRNSTGKRTLSAAARERIAQAQRERWKKFKAAKKR